MLGVRCARSSVIISFILVASTNTVLTFKQISSMLPDVKEKLLVVDDKAIFNLSK